MDTPIHRESAVPIEGKTLGPIPEASRLRQGTLSLFDIATSTMANIAPAMSFYFSFALIVGAAGIASPLIIIIAGIAIALLGNTLAEFSKAIPSTGSFVTFIGKTFGPVMAITTALVVSIGYIVAIASVIDISGGWTQIIISHYWHVNVPWQILTLIFTIIAFLTMIRGVAISTRVAGIFFLFEMIVLVLVSIIALASNAGHLSAAPFNPGRISGGLSGLGLAFPIAVYMFVGWENSAALAEETANPRRNIPRAIYASVALIGLTYAFFGYATVVGLHYDLKAAGSLTVPPFLLAAEKLGALLVLLAYVAGFTSTIGALIAASNSQSRLIFNASREGLLPSVLARVTPRTRAPWVSFVVFFAIGLGITYIFGWNIDPVTFFGEIATLGTILIALTYLVSNLALPVYYRRYLPQQFSPVRHLVLPLLGVFAIGFPLWGLVQPNQPAPFNLFPWIALAIIVVSLVYALIMYRRDPALGDRVGSMVADRE